MSTDQDECKILPEELVGIEKIRIIFDGKIPSDLNTDFHLLRWIHGWKSQMTEIEPRFRAYIENRKAAKLDDAKYLDQYHQHPVYKYLKYFSISQEKSLINPKDNCILLIQRLENIDLHKIPKIISCGEFSMFMFVMCEAFLRHILNRETESGKPSGLTVLFDMKGLNLLQYANLNAPIFKILKDSLVILQDFYCDILHKVYVVNAPAVVTVMWEMIKRFLNPNTQQKFVIYGSDFKDDLKNVIDLNVLPVHYGGIKRDTSGTVNPDTLCPNPKTITQDDFYNPKKVENWTTEYIKPNTSFEIRKTVDVPYSILTWQFWVNSDVEFAVIKNNQGKKKYDKNH